MSNQKITILANGTDTNDAVNFKQFSSLNKSYIKREINIVGNLAVGNAYMYLMLILNVVSFCDL